MNTGVFDDSYWKGVELSTAIFTPHFTAESMPSIRHFGGPGCVVGALLKSNLSKQLEVLELIEPMYKEFGTISGLLQQIGSSIVPELPHLRALGITVYSNDDKANWQDALRALCELADRMPMLEELLIYVWGRPRSDELEELFQLLSRLLRLRRLAVPTTWWGSSHEFRSVYERTKISFPRLQVVNSSQLTSTLF
ncbi:unnamed protein product [Rhizoctonia solani]|uniref:Uncharacterized protein n=1 Tax=Rhizoctonia solani TaxID=456999 RepID=A0A8H2ZY84_9AGAM|nr:unnamed protein product [Rhizoctonia solani]